MARTALQLTFGVLGLLAILAGAAFLVSSLVRRVDQVPAWMSWMPALLVLLSGAGLLLLGEVGLRRRGPSDGTEPFP